MTKRSSFKGALYMVKLQCERRTIQKAVALRPCPGVPMNFQDRREPIHGGSGKNILFLTVLKIHRHSRALHGDNWQRRTRPHHEPRCSVWCSEGISRTVKNMDVFAEPPGTDS